MNYKYPFDIRAGTIIEVITLPDKENYLLKINFGSIIGIKDYLYKANTYVATHQLIGKHICAITNFDYQSSSSQQSNIILLSMLDSKGFYMFIQPDTNIPNGGSLFQ